MIVTAQKNISYSVDEVRKSIAELNDISIEDTSVEEALEIIWGFITEDFGDSYGVVLIDEDGQEV
jgi:signal transduction histidine kinase